MNNLLIAVLTIVLFFSGNTDSLGNNDPEEVREHSNTVNSISNKRTVKLSSLGFANNRAAANKRLSVKNSITFKDDPSPTPVDVSQKLKNAGELVGHAKSVFNKVTKNRLFLTALKGKNIELPFGVSKVIGQREYTIVVDSIVITPNYAYGVLYTVLKDPGSTDSLAFGAKVTLGEDGSFGAYGGKLFLLSDETINLGQNNTIEFLGTNDQTFVEFDCNGFNLLKAELRLTLLKNQMVLKSDPNQDVSFITNVEFENFDDWVIGLTGLPAFQFKGLNDFIFSAGGLFLDRSPTKNPEAFDFPDGYHLEDNQDLWEGFGITGLTVTLPPQFKNKENDVGITLSVDNAVIDRRGFTGSVSGTNILPLDKGDMNGWAFSLDKLSVELYQSQFQNLYFDGRMVLPVAEEGKPLAYTGAIDIAESTRYFFSVQPGDSLEFPLWGASEIVLYSDSRIDVLVENKKFLPEAVLSGKMDISASVNKSGENTPGDGASLELAQIRFQQLHISSQSPYLFLDPANGAFSVGSPNNKQSMAKLPITLSAVGMKSEEIAGRAHTGVHFTLRVNLTGNNDAGQGFGANSTAIVWGEKAETNWVYDRCELQRLELERVALGPLTMAGYVEFFRDDIVYGTGFAGGIDLDIEVGKGNLGIDVVAIFGKMMNDDKTQLLYRYWAVDALVNLPVRIPVISPLLYINGFGGGASYRMALQSEITSSGKFQTLSGVGYAPDQNTGLGLRAMLGIEGEKKNAYVGQVAFEIVFDTDGSVNDVAFSGFVEIASLGNLEGINTSKVKEMASKYEGALAQNPDNTKAVLAAEAEKTTDQEVNNELAQRSEQAAVIAQWLMRMDFVNKVFTADVSVFVNVENRITGTNPYNNAGTLEVLFAPDTWYIYVGKPAEPMGLSFNSLGIRATAYVVMGTELPPLVPPDGYEGTWNFADDVQAGSTKGFGFGARLLVNKTRNEKRGLKYDIDIGVGFDVLLRDVTGKVCKETGEPLGIKNWYVTGTTFVYVKGWAKLGLTWNGSIALYLTVNAPNPTNVNGYFRVAGFKVPINVGQTCTIY